MEASNVRKRMPVSTLLDPKIVGPAIADSFRKLDPRIGRIFVRSARSLSGAGAI